jgi:hypothetical protein
VSFSQLSLSLSLSLSRRRRRPIFQLHQLTCVSLPLLLHHGVVCLFFRRHDIIRSRHGVARDHQPPLSVRLPQRATAVRTLPHRVPHQPRVGQHHPGAGREGANRQFNANKSHVLSQGAVYTCDSAFKLPYDSMNDFLLKVVCHLISNIFFLMCVDKQL